MVLAGGLGTALYLGRGWIAEMRAGTAQEALRDTAAGSAATASAEGAAGKHSPEDLQGIVQKVYQQSRPKTPDDFIEQIQRVREDAIVFGYQNSERIVQGKYDAEIERIGKALGHLFRDISAQGTQAAQQLHGALGQKLEHIKRDVRREICQPEITRIAEQLYDILDSSFTPESRREMQYLRAMNALEQMDKVQLAQYAAEVHTRLPEEARIAQLKERGLDTALQEMEKAFGVKFSQ